MRIVGIHKNEPFFAAAVAKNASIILGLAVERWRKRDEEKDIHISREEGEREKREILEL